MTTDKNVAYTYEYLEHRREFDSIFESPEEPYDSIVLGNGKYHVEIFQYTGTVFIKRFGTLLDHSVLRLSVRDKENDILAEIKAIDNHEFITLVEHQNGLDYLLYRTELYGYSVLELVTGKSVDYIPESSFTGGEETFIWVDIKYCPLNNLLVVDGCYWACPFEFEFYDFSNPMDLPLPLYGDTSALEYDIVPGVENVEFDENGNCRMKIKNSNQTVLVNHEDFLER